MTDKHLTVVLYACDRTLWRGGPLKIEISDIFAAGGPRPLYRGETEAATLDLQLSLPFGAGQVYGFTFSAPEHRPAWRLVRRSDFIRLPDNVEHDTLLLRLMLVPDSPGTSDLTNGFGKLRQRASPFAGAALNDAVFQALPVAAQMACLNIEAKLRDTYVDGASVLSYVRGVSHVGVDRVFLFFDSGLKDRVERATDFAGAAGHAAPRAHPELPAHPDSWKHDRFAEGNVQLSFSRDTVPLPGSEPPLPVHSADVDIDLGKGLAHVVEWLENNVFRPGHKTNQALVYGLLYDQNILPSYTLDPVPATTSRGMGVRLSRVSEARQRRRRPTPKRNAASVRRKASGGSRRRRRSR